MEEKSNLPPGAKMVDKKHFVIKGEKYRGHRENVKTDSTD